MARSITFKKIARESRPTGDVVLIRAGKTEIEIPVRADNVAADVRNWVREWINEDIDEFMIKLGLALWLKRNPNMGNPGQLVDKTLTFDLDGPLNTANGIVRLG